MKFYVYVYQDPRVPGNFTYGRYRFSFKPFYVGKGQGKRYLAHLRCTDKVNTKKNAVISSILVEGLDPVVSFVYRTDSEEEAYRVEAHIISRLGQHNLVNMTGGGSGTSSGEGHPWFGKKHTNETIMKLRNNAFNRTPDHQNKINLGKTGTHHTEEAKRKISAATSGENNPYFGKKHTEEIKDKMRGRVVSEENRQKLSEMYKHGVCTTEAAKENQRRNTLRGEEHPHYGKPRGTETITKMILNKVKFRSIVTNGIDTFVTYNIKAFCKAHDLDSGALFKTFKGSQEWHKGFKYVSREDLLPCWQEDSEKLNEYLELTEALKELAA